MTSLKRVLQLQAALETDFSSQHLDSHQLRASEHLLSNIFKKNTDVRNPDAGERALQLFLECNAHCKAYKGFVPQWEVQNEIFGRMRAYLATWTLHPQTQEPYSMSAIFERADFGPGASRGTRHTHYFMKVRMSALTATNPELVRWWSLYTGMSKRHKLTERSRSTQFGNPYIIMGSKFTTVPKKSTIDRGIATEPSLNMFFQKGLAGCFTAALRIHTGLNPEIQQERARRLARRGSKDGKFGTIDLKSASDFLSARLIHELFPSQVLTLLDLTRSKYVEINGSNQKLFMMATMGCGWTFALQTMVYSALVLSVYDVLGIKQERPRGFRDGNYSVFGDDIIVERKAYSSVISMLKLMGLIPNEDKSFNDGFFRESCGGDYHCGKDIRSVYNIDTSQPHHICSTRNLLACWSTRHRILLCETMRVFDCWLPKAPYIPVVGFLPSEGFWHPDTTSIKLPCNKYGFRCVRPYRVKSRNLKLNKVIDPSDDVILAALKGALRRELIGLRQNPSSETLYERKPVVISTNQDLRFVNVVDRRVSEKLLRGIRLRKLALYLDVYVR